MKKTKTDVTPQDEFEFEISYPVSSFSKENNEAFEKRRIKCLNLNMLLVWIGRHVVRDHPKNSKWFKGEEKDGEYVFSFKLECDKDNAEIFLDEILQNGIPRIKHF